ncbi:MAG: hypothetical protein WEB57_00635 [Pseudohongiellaceae bacterium]
MAKIIERLNDLFASEELTDKGKVSTLNILANKVIGDEAVMAQIKSNIPEWAIQGSYHSAVQITVIESKTAYEKLAVSRSAAERLQVLKKGRRRQLTPKSSIQRPRLKAY